MDLNPLVGITIQVVPDYPIFKTKPMPAKRKWGPKLQRVKVLSHYDNALKDGQILHNVQQGIFFMNPRTKAELDNAIDTESRKPSEPRFIADYGFHIRVNSSAIACATGVP